MAMPTDMPKRVNALLASLLETYDPRYGLGSMTCSVYDTAWVASITKTVAGVPQYLFPSAFFFVLDAQLPCGSWNAHYCAEATKKSIPGASEEPPNLLDSILSTMAALYTLALHAKSPHQIRPARLPAPSLEIRIAHAVASLESMLIVWRLATSNAVGFEVLVPAMLDLLAGQGFAFEFPERDSLFKMRAAKIKRVSPAMLYEKAPTTLLHSLEAFHGWTNDEFDVTKVKHHRVQGSMMASPAATASYLMKASSWDDEAEAYLRLAIECGDGKGTGGVPSAWPSTNFEIIWVSLKNQLLWIDLTEQIAQVVSTLLEAGLWTKDDGNLKRELVLKIINEARGTTGGLVGFSKVSPRDFVASKESELTRTQLPVSSPTLTTALKHPLSSVSQGKQASQGPSRRLLSRPNGSKHTIRNATPASAPTAMHSSASS